MLLAKVIVYNEEQKRWRIKRIHRNFECVDVDSVDLLQLETGNLSNASQLRHLHDICNMLIVFIACVLSVVVNDQE